MSRLHRQSFLGPGSDLTLWRSTIGFVGLGGGGSHLVQQCAHAGIGGYVLVDPQSIDDTNTNRLISGTLADVEAYRKKVAIAERLIRGLNPKARIKPVPKSWHEAVDDLKVCYLIVGAVDSFKEREQLERFCRRYLIPYVDVGMDVLPLQDGGHLIAGQVILSTPGNPCLRCCGLITDERLEQEARTYGAAGPRPQVVWPNGVLASTAMGLVVQILTPWHRSVPAFTYLEYDGNKGTVSVSKRVDLLRSAICEHHPADETGDPMFDIRKHLSRPQPVPVTTIDAGDGTWWSRFMKALKAVLAP